MENLPSIELLEANHRFPGPYQFKVIGSPDNQFADRVLGAVRETLGIEQSPPLRERASRGGKHIALTVECTLENSEQVHKVYQRIQAEDGVLVLF